MLYKRVISQKENNPEEMPNKLHTEINKDEAWAALLNAPGFIRYITKYGWHFTDKLAEYASKMMLNSDKSNHVWNCKTLAKEYLSLNLNVPKDITWGDLTYTANMAYADFYPNICSTEKDCIMYASLVANDVDGYPGMIFHRWIADIIGKQILINWEEFI